MVTNIILTEDDADDIMFFKLALKEIGFKYASRIAKNGEELIELLTDSKNLPQIIFLDLNMPILNGFDCLKIIRKDERLDNCKVVILTTTKHSTDVNLCRSLGADLFLQKPVQHGILLEALQSILLTDYLSNNVITEENFMFHS